MEAKEDNYISSEITEKDQERYLNLVSTDLSREQIKRVTTPPETYPAQKTVMGVHWHPEFIPLDLIMKRVSAMFPNRETELLIPTQHNRLTTLNGFAGVEVDCYTHQFNRKVQLLLHFEASRIEGDRASVMKEMLNYTFKYRNRQLLEFIDTIIEDRFRHLLEFPAKKTGADTSLIELVKFHTRKLKSLIEQNESITPPEMIRNKLIRNYFNLLRDEIKPEQIERAQIFLREVKKIIKANFPLNYFYRTSEVIEEARSLKAGIVIPHPEQFWPILLADYDVDGYEVWNPQSREYTEFLINAVNRQNRTYRRDSKPLLVFMGDDTHFGEKVLDPKDRNIEKEKREIGLHPAWEDRSIRKSLILAGADRKRVIEEYKSRLLEG